MPPKGWLEPTSDIAAYLRRIGLDPPMPSDLLDKNRLALLQRIMLAHSRTIPFENLDVVLGRWASAGRPAPHPENEPVPACARGCVIAVPGTAPQLSPSPIRFRAATRRPISLEPKAVEEKLLHQGRGGYCMETNMLLGMALMALGYSVVPLLVRLRPLASTHPLPLSADRGSAIASAGRLQPGVAYAGQAAAPPDSGRWQTAAAACGTYKRHV
jgi:hypothetical protein